MASHFLVCNFFQSASKEVSPTTGGRVRRDSGCYLSNENINNNSSNSSTCEKKSDSGTLTPLPTLTSNSESGSQSNELTDRLRSQMSREGIDLTLMPYTDEVRIDAYFSTISVRVKLSGF